MGNPARLRSVHSGSMPLGMVNIEINIKIRVVAEPPIHPAE
jgi:hypothetical protein